jgi:hypothetical protein
LQYISVCDPDKPNIPVPREIAPVRYFDGSSIAESGKILGVLNQELSRYALLETKPMSRLSRGRFAAPLLVRRLDTKGDHYYLVPAMSGSSVVGYAQVNALYGNLESAFTMKRGAKPFETDVRRVGERLDGVRIELPQEKGRFRLLRGKYQLAENLVWQPCRESYSPHLPFWQITSGPLTLYQRIDGLVFSQLTPMGKGD